MSDFPDLNQYGYQINEELGRNREGGRITWKAIELKSKKTVVIKQFCFATAGSTWSGYKAYKQELDILQKLDCKGIPQYLSSIETKDGFCLIQEYISASSLKNRHLSICQVKQVGLKVLDILIYLQAQDPPILHRDLKPDNILLDEEFNAYLIDFGFASLRKEEISGSSVFKGTPGFIAPEQIIQPTLASDIYGLGVTLVCLLSNKSISEIQDLAVADDPYQLDIRNLLPQLDRQFRNWLEKMTYAKTSKRYSDARTAKAALLSIMAADNSSLVLDSSGELDNSSLDPRIALATVAIASLSTISVWGIRFIDHHLESTVVNIAIAVIAAGVVGVTQLGAVEIVQTDREARLEGGVLGIGIPILLVIASGFIWGIGEAVDICGAIAIAETSILAYFWWGVPFWSGKSIQIKSSVLFVAIAFGVILGIRWI